MACTCSECRSRARTGAAVGAAIGGAVAGPLGALIGAAIGANGSSESPRSPVKDLNTQLNAIESPNEYRRRILGDHGWNPRGC